ncbi:type I DNA topoisomerase [Candidatus Xianfuyuplasma coldseepsis]|uniref:DNA topoisomerase 1 n=1 Tax=Candidatus Xianfuyuplasma coldseepsis TaxID=2782163 RepID=A0A7L7KSZ8_9MOLU|nr:type I DNA topoisomerase [Xianfuyuplasma coldseepsis]QMS85402.1 type I DNA topoisomerase [Xianfuyuplasma coldseepsis]
MSQKLVIVESPSKSKTIEQYLGPDYTVLSSKGHIRDLAIRGQGGLGLDIDNDFQPQYEVIKEKKKVVADLKKAVHKTDEVFLATDPDREGEAISWHLFQTLDIGDRPTHRVIFNEITRDRVLEAFEHPRDIDYNLVSSQETRRILDRIIGFKLSKLLQNKIKSKSAGRVQSATLKIIVDKEKEIQAFVPEEYWKVQAQFELFNAELAKFNNTKVELSSEQETNELVATLDDNYLVATVEQRERKRETKLPFTTSSLQQEASNKLNFSSRKTMLIAQRLYEGIDLANETVGLITYMRTDSIRLSETFSYPAIKFIEEEYGKAYKGYIRKAKKSLNVQDAHEAIRPTSVFHRPKDVKQYLSRDEYNLYKLIYNRTLASLMKAAKIQVTDVLLTNQQAEFKASAQEVVFDGYLKVYTYDTVQTSQLPELTEGDVLTALNVETTQNFTSPPARYSEARLIKEMEDLGIGRPSTYSQTISTLKNRKYVSVKEKRFIPTEQGMLTIEKLDQFFSQIVSADYTARMEKVLDDISEGEEHQTRIVTQFYNSFIPMVENANKNMEKIAPKYTGEDCPKCGHKMVFRQSKYGTFEACSNFPACKYIKTKEKEARIEPKTTGITCPKCGTGEIVERVAKKGRNAGKTFYACNNFPKCRNMLFGKPTGEACPECGRLLIENDKGEVVCSNSKECGFVVSK